MCVGGPVHFDHHLTLNDWTHYVLSFVYSSWCGIKSAQM